MPLPSSGLGTGEAKVRFVNNVPYVCPPMREAGG